GQPAGTDVLRRWWQRTARRRPWFLLPRREPPAQVDQAGREPLESARGHRGHSAGGACRGCPPRAPGTRPRIALVRTTRAGAPGGPAISTSSSPGRLRKLSAVTTKDRKSVV